VSQNWLMLAGGAGALVREKRRERQDSLTEGPAPKPSAVTPTRALGVFGRPFAELAPGERDAVEGTAPRHLRGSSASATVNCMFCCLACIARTLA
jgi:hypothetical protein